MRKINILLAASVASVLAPASVAFAQSAEPEAAVPAEDQNAQADSGYEIVVTARRREETLQDVPLSVAVISGDSLAQQNITGIERLTSALPGLATSLASSSRDNIAFAIRGQRSSETAILNDPPVGLYFAEVVQPRNFGFARALYDLQSVQVLKGVQGTLFGRNMTGGAILVEPHRPEYKFGTEVRAEVGNLNLRSAYAMVNVPVIDDVLAVRANFIKRTRDGFTIDNRTGRDYDNQDYYSGRLSVLFQPSSSITIYTVFDHLHAEDNGTGSVTTRLRQVNDPSINTGGVPFAGRDAVLGAGGAAALAAAFQQQQQLGPRRVVGSVFFGDHTGLGNRLPYPNERLIPMNVTDNTGITNHITIEVTPELTVKNIAGYRDVRYFRNIDFFNLPFYLITNQTVDDVQQFSEEFQVRYAKGPFDGIVGAYYFQEQGLGEFGLINQLSGAAPDPSQATLEREVYGKAKSAAVFAAGTIDVLDTVKVSGGIRYNWDKREVRSYYISRTTGACRHVEFPNGAGVCRFNNENTWDAVTWDATLQWEPTASLNFYAALRKGYRAGGFNARSAISMAQVQPFNPESVLEVELGAKAQWNLGGGWRGSSSLAIYDQDMTNAQTTRSILVNGSLTQITANVGAQHNIGVDFDTTIRSDFGLSFTIAYAYNDVVRTVNRPVQSPFGSPKHQASFQVNYNVPLGGNAGDLNFAGDYSYRSRIHLDDVDPRADQPAYGLMNLNLTWNNAFGSGFGGSVFINNVTDKVYMVGNRSLDDSGTNFGLTTSVFGEPRTYGLALFYKF